MVMRKLALTFSILMTLVLPLQAIAGWSSCLFEQESGQEHQMMMGDHDCCPDTQDQQSSDHHCQCNIVAFAALPPIALNEQGINLSVRYLTPVKTDWPSQTYQPEKPPQIS